MNSDENTGAGLKSRPALWLILLVLLPLVILVLAAYGLALLFLHVALWLTWGPIGRNVLFVYSNSPVWQQYVEENILPRLPPNTMILNWSERRNWGRISLAHVAFRVFGGSREFNPLAVVVRPLRWAKCFRFWKPFRDFKHGNPETLLRMERDLFDHLRHG
jgi:hypothetical protein